LSLNKTNIKNLSLKDTSNLRFTYTKGRKNKKKFYHEPHEKHELVISTDFQRKSEFSLFVMVSVVSGKIQIIMLFRVKY
jgi:hypothetical protein